jgi:hypothetical protein
MGQAAEWSAAAGGAPVYCGEFGVWRQHVAAADRIAWIADVAGAMRRALGGVHGAVFDYSYGGGFSFLGAADSWPPAYDKDQVAAVLTG